MTTLFEIFACEGDASSSPLTMRNLRERLVSHIAKIPQEHTLPESYHNGRVAHARVETMAAGGVSKIGDVFDEVVGQSNFASIRGNVCLYAGKWMYEAIISTTGVMQIGWFSPTCVFSEEEGVGDSPDSFAYDGNRVKKWSNGAGKYGQQWAPFDVIGSCIDFEKREISFYRNGECMGVAYQDIKANLPGFGYYPGMSISTLEKAIPNWGAFPFKYPVEGFLPLQQPPDPHTTETAKYLLSCMKRLTVSHTGSPMTELDIDDVVIITSIIFEFLAQPLRDPYIVSTLLVPVLQELCLSENASVLPTFIHLLSIGLSPQEFTKCMEDCVSYICLSIRTTTIHTVIEECNKHNTTTPPCTSMLDLASRLCGCTEVHNLMLQKPESAALWIEGFLSLKPLSTVDIEKLFPVINFPENPDNVPTQIQLVGERCISQLDSALLVLWRLQEKVTKTLFNSPVLLPWLEALVVHNKDYDRSIPPAGLTDIPVLTNIFFIALSVALPFLRTANPAELDMSIFFQSPVCGLDLPRVGGVHEHLFKESPPSSDQLAVMSSSLEQKRNSKLVHYLVCLYHYAITRRFRSLYQNIQNQQKAIAMYLKAETAAGFEAPKQLMKQDAMETVRLVSYYKGTLFNASRQNALFDLCQFLVKVLNTTSTSNPLFSYIPEWYIEVPIDAFHALRRADPPFSFLHYSNREFINSMLWFLCSHYSDTRIKHPDTKELVLQTLLIILQIADYKFLFEENLEACRIMGNKLITVFEPINYVLVTKIFIFLWKGKGFAQPSGVHIPYGAAYQGFVDSASDQELFDQFLNKVFNALNQTASEFAVALKEEKSGRGQIEQIRRKVDTFLDFSVALTRILEIVSIELPATVLNNEVTLVRLSEFIIFSLNRGTIGPDSALFKQLCSAHDFSALHFGPDLLLAPVVGICSSLHEFNNKLVSALVKTPGFSLDYFKYLVNHNWMTALEQFTENPNLSALASFVTFTEALSSAASSVPTNQLQSVPVEGELCAICCTSPIDTVFEPCKHESCHMCIQRHLLNTKTCFFCNAPVTHLQSKGSQPSTEKTTNDS
ncbi:E3 ubiquitin-protein ligase RKP [Pelomyxa schiedti]|nr:E3 ubiquitin-protein ligase RKP [Pelomyxa schiedti]